MISSMDFIQRKAYSHRIHSINRNTISTKEKEWFVANFKYEKTQFHLCPHDAT